MRESKRRRIEEELLQRVEMAESEVAIAEAEEAIVIGPTTETEEGEGADGENTALIEESLQ